VNALSPAGEDNGEKPASMPAHGYRARATAWRILLPKVDRDSPQ
jgi:hypothetical protein